MIALVAAELFIIVRQSKDNQINGFKHMGSTTQRGSVGLVVDQSIPYGSFPLWKHEGTCYCQVMHGVVLAILLEHIVPGEDLGEVVNPHNKEGVVQGLNGLFPDSLGEDLYFPVECEGCHLEHCLVEDGPAMDGHAGPLEEQVVEEHLLVVPLVLSVDKAGHLKEELQLQF